MVGDSFFPAVVLESISAKKLARIRVVLVHVSNDLRPGWGSIHRQNDGKGHLHERVGNSLAAACGCGEDPAQLVRIAVLARREVRDRAYVPVIRVGSEEARILDQLSKLLLGAGPQELCRVLEVKLECARLPNGIDMPNREPDG